MSVIDERVVEMQFDNAQFEKNVATSLNTLDKLKAALKLDGSSKGLEELQSSANKFNMNPLISAVETVNAKFSALDVIGTTALVNITNRAIAAGESLIKSLSVDNISAGWDKFGEKTQSVATLVSQGYDLSVVEDQMKRLNWFTDETSYNFTDMVSNISKFTASGQELEPSVTAMMGIANWAALSGQNATTASRAMYQLSQAMGKGVLKYDDWRSIQNASMDTVEFRQQAVKAAEALGKIKKVGEDAYEIIGGKKAQKFSLAELFTSDALSRQQWFTSDVMMGTFKQYSSAVDQIYEHVDEYDGIAANAMKGMSGQLDEFGLKAFKAAQQARTFRDVIDATKDAVSTGWMNTFEYIFGNYEEATELWSGLAEVFYNVFAAGGELRNEMMAIWKEAGGRKILLEAISTGFEDILAIVRPLKEVLAEFIPKDAEIRAEALKAATESLLNLFQNLSLTSGAANDLKDAFRGVLSFIGLLVDGFKAITYILKPLLQPLNILGGYILQLAGYIGRSITGFRSFTKSSRGIADAVLFARNAVQIFSNILSLGIIKVANFIKQAAKFVNLNKAIKTFNNFIKTMGTRIAPYFNKVTKVVDSVIKKFTSLFSLADVKSGFTKALSEIGKRFEQLGTFASKAFNKILPYFNTAKAKVTEFFNSFSSGTSKLQNVDIIGKIGDIVSKVGEKLGQARDAIANFIRTIREAESPLEAFQKIFGQVKDKISEFAKTVKEFAKNSGLEELKDKFIKSFNEIIRKIQELGAARILLFTFGVAITTMMLEIGNAAGSAAKMFTAITTIPNLISKTITQITRLSATNSILQVAEAIGILALSLKLLSTIPSDKLADCAAALLLLSLAMGAIAVVMSKFGSASGFAENAAGIVALSGSVLLLAVSLALLENIKFEHLMESMKVLGMFALGLIAASRLMSFASAANAFNVAMLLAFAFSLEKITNAFVKLVNEIDPKVATQALETLKIMMIGLGAIAFAAKGVGIGSALGLVGIIFSLDLLYGMMAKIADSTINMDTILQNLSKFQAVFLFLGALMLTARLAGNAALGAAAFILAIGVSMTLIVGVIERLSALNEMMGSENWPKVVDMFNGLFLGLTLLLATTSLAGEHSVKAAVALLAITGCMYLLVGVIQSLSEVVKTMTLMGTFEKTVATLAGLLVIFGLLMAASALTGKAKVGAIISIMAAVGILIAGMAVLSDPSLDQDRMMKTAAGMAIIMAGLGACFLLAGNIAKDANTGAMFAITGAIIALIGGLIIIMDMSKNLDPGAATEAAMAIGIVLMSFGATMWILAGAAKLAETALPGAAAILVVALSMIPMAAALMLLAFTFNSVSTEAIATSVGAMILVMLAMAGAATMASTAIVGAAAMVVMSASLLIAAGSLALLAALDPNQLQNAVIAIGLIIGAFAALAFLSMSSGGTFSAALVSVAGALGTLAFSLIGIAAAALIFAFAVDTIVGALERLANITDEQATQIGDNIVQILASVGTGLGEGIKNLAKSLWEGIKELFANIKAAFAGNKDVIKTSARGAFEGVASAISEMASNALSALGEFLSGIINAITSKASDFLNAAKSSCEQFTTGIRTSIAGAIKTAKDFIKQIVDVIKSKAEDFKQAAINCVQGFINGFGSMVDTAIESVKGFAGNVLSVFNVQLGNASPSKKFAKSGYFCVAGFTHGIEKNSNMAIDATVGMAEDLGEAFNDTLGIHSDADWFIEASEYCASAVKHTLTDNETIKKTGENMASTLGDGFNGNLDKVVNGAGVSKITDDLHKQLEESGTMSFSMNPLTGEILGLNDAANIPKLFGKSEKEAMGEEEDELERIRKVIGDGTDSTKEYSKATTSAAKSSGGMGKASKAAGEDTKKAAKQIDTLTDLMDYAGRAVGYFNNKYSLTQDSLSNTQATQKSKDAMELLAFQLYEVSIASETAEEKAERMKKSQLEVAADIKKAYLDTRDGIAEALKGQIDLFKMADFGEKKKGGDLLEMARSQDRLMTSFTQSFEKLAERTAGLDGAEELMWHFANEGASSMGDLKSVLDMTAEELKEFAGYAEKYYGKTSDVYTDAADQMMASIGYVSYKAAGGFAEGLDPKTAEEAFENFTAAGLNKMYEKFGMSVQGDRSERMATIAQELAQSFSENLDTSKAEEASETTGNAVVGKFGEIVNEESGAEGAVNFCDGMINGFADKKGEVIAAVEDVANGAKDVLSDVWQMNSPSKLTEKYGGFFDLGLVNGILKFGSNVKQAVATTALSATNELTDTFNRIADLVDGNLDLDPTIRPVLDLSNIQYGASQIGSLLGLNDPYALNAVGTISGIQNDAQLMAGLTSSLTDAINGMKTDNDLPPVTINIYPTEGQSAEEIADAVSWKFNHDVLKRRAAYGGT